MTNPSKPSELLKVENLTLRLEDLTLFQELNFDIEREKITVIVGPNGSGKTSILKTIAGVIKPSCGSIKNTAKSTFYLPQKITYPEGITLFEYLSSIFFNKGFKWFLKKEEKERIENILSDLEISDKRNIRLELLSSGEIQKANIALGLLSGADLLLLDEPTSNMDLINQMKILEILKRLKSRKVTTVVILHDLNLASNYGDNFIGINSARRIFCAKRKSFFSDSILENVFGLKFKVVSGEKNFFIQVFS